MDIDWGAEQPAGGVDRRLLRRVTHYFWPYRRKALLVTVLIGIESALALAPALAAAAFLDYLTHRGRSFSHVLLLVGAGFLGVAIAALVGVIHSYFSAVISEGIMFDLRNELAERLMRQSPAFFTKRRAGEVMSRVGNDVHGVEHVVSDTLFGFVSNALIAVTTLAGMLAMDWRMTAFSLIALPLALPATRRAGRSMYRARLRTQTKLGEFTAKLQELLGISGMMLVKAFGRAQAEQDQLRSLNADLRRLRLREALIGRWFQAFMNLLSDAGPVLLLLPAGYLVLYGGASVGSVFVVATVLTGRLFAALASFGSVQVNLTGSLGVFGRLFEYLDLPDEVRERAKPVRLNSVRGNITFDNVSVTYAGNDRPAISGVSLEISAGQLVALVGPSGAGKTTLSNLVPRFLDPQSGRVLVDGHDVRDLSLDSLARHVGVVFQDPFLFHTTIGANLLYARPEATMADMHAAAKVAQIHDFVVSLPGGYETVVGERGHRLSGGEKQRLALARVILKNPSILILDEATSSLDTVTEAQIQAALKPLLRGRTSLVIAHRLSTILAADVIVVMEHGRVVEIGSHGELLDAGGVYSGLYERQFAPEATAA